MSDGMIMATPSLAVTPARFREWMQGIRPLQGQDERFFFREQVRSGMLSDEEAHQFLMRHQALTRAEDGAEACLACGGQPPPGFTCNHCGLG